MVGGFSFFGREDVLNRPLIGCGIVVSVPFLRFLRIETRDVSFEAHAATWWVFDTSLASSHRECLQPRVIQCFVQPATNKFQIMFFTIDAQILNCASCGDGLRYIPQQRAQMLRQ